MREITKKSLAKRPVVRYSKLRSAKPRLLAYSSMHIQETCGCGQYYESVCGRHHSGNTGPGCGHYYSSVCGINHSCN